MERSLPPSAGGRSAWRQPSRLSGGGLGGRRALPHVVPRTRATRMAVHGFFMHRGVCSRHIYVGGANTAGMGDFMAVLGIIIFAVVMLGLIWGLDHV